LELIKLYNFEEYRNYQRQYRNERILLENRIMQECEKNRLDYIWGYCEVCEKVTKFKLRKKKSILAKIKTGEKTGKNLRDSLACEFCLINTRNRFTLGLVKDLAKNSDSVLNVFMYEQVTRPFKIAQNIHNIILAGSEFLGYDKKPGQIINNIRHEDAMNLSFENNSFDVIVSNDIYEHIPNIERTLSEAYRILKNSGKLLISIPFHIKSMKTTKRATIVDEKIEHQFPPIYHGNPVAKKEGSLVFYDYGWDFLDLIKTAGFDDVHMLAYYDIFYGHLGNALQFIFVGQK